MTAETELVAPVTELNEVAAYPAPSPALERILEFASGDAAKSRRALLSLNRPMASAEVVEGEKRFQTWFRLLEAGAFAPPIGDPDDEVCLPGSISQFDEVTLEIAVDRFRASEQAWVVLGNMALSWPPGREHAARFLVD